MVPKGWTDGRVEDLLNGLESGVSVNGEDRQLLNGEKGVLKVSAVTYGTFDPTAVKVIQRQDELNRAKINPRKSQIIISRSNTESLVGASAYINSDYPELFLPDKLWQTIPKPDANMKWLSYVLSSEPVRYTLSNLATGTSGSMKNITKGEFLSLRIAIPPLPEQQKIAKILSTWDQAISTTDHLIENSTQQKRALMQQLLTGKKRLLDESGKRFEGEWKEATVSSFGKVITGSTPPKNDSSNYDGNISWATAEDFKRKYVSNTKVKLTESGAAKARVVPKGSVLVTCIASIGKNAIANESLATNQQINSVVINKNNSNEFFYYLIEFNTHKLLAWAGTTAVPILNKTSFEKVKFIVPNLKEQQKIATVLTNADKEIELLEQQLADLQQEKKALMQVLLTGKVRVVVDEDNL